jgi:hypothetical protein
MIPPCWFAAASHEGRRAEALRRHHPAKARIDGKARHQVLQALSERH